MRDVSNKSKTSPNRGTGKRIRLLMFAMLGFMTWACFMFWNQQGQLNAKAAQLEQLENMRRETANLNEAYKKEIQRLNDSEYILQKIRKEYHYSRPGETLFLTPKPSVKAVY